MINKIVSYFKVKSLTRELHNSFYAGHISKRKYLKILNSK
jgi:hypothetical protein